MGARALLLRAFVGSCALLSLLTFTTDALAGYGHKLLSSFGSFSRVQGVAVDSSTGEVYVYDAEAGSIFKFDGTGNPVNFAASATNAIEGGRAGNGEAELAVDNSSGPAKGAIYLATGGTKNVLIFSPEGKQIGELSHGSGEACGVATDPSGDVYVGIFPNLIEKYVPSGNPLSGEPSSSIVNADQPCNLAADSTGSVFAVKYSAGPVTRYEAGQFGSLSPSGDVISATGSTLAVDPANDEVYVDDMAHVMQFAAHGEPGEAPVATLGNFGGSFGVAVSGLNHDVYVSDGSGAIDVFGPTAFAADPAASTGAASNVQPESATVSGAANPNGTELSECKFEYGTTTSYGQTAPCAESPTEIGAGSSPVAVHADLSSLGSGTVYHYRLVASNFGGSADGEDQTFRTPAKPEVGTGLASNIQPESATISGAVNPELSELSECKFEYGTATSYGQTASCAESPAQVGSGSSLVEVHADLTNLKPGTSYRYRLVVANVYGSTTGGDRTFATPAAPLLSGEFAFNVASTETDVGGQVNPNGAPTTYHLDYGTSSSYGQSTSESQSIGAVNDNSYHQVTVHLTGLAPGATYHARLVATNSAGSTAGTDFTFTTFLPQPVTTGACPNEARREEQNATYLPDCRAYEKVSPQDKNGSDVIGNGRYMQVSAAGDRVNYGTAAGFGEDTKGSSALGVYHYVGEREEGKGWTSRGVTPTSATNVLELFGSVGLVELFSESMDKAIVAQYDLPDASGDIPKIYNLYEENADTGALEAITKPVSGESYGEGDFETGIEGASPDLGLVAVESEKNLLPGMPAGMKYYIWNHGTMELAGVLPDGSLPVGGSGSPVPGGKQFYSNQKTFSRDDSRVLFRAPASGPRASQLYMRRDGRETVWVSQAESSAPPAEPHVYYQDMTPDGTKVVFASSEPLTDSDPGGVGYGLYLYTDSPHPETEPNLTFIARLGLVESAQEVARGEAVMGMSEDGARIYFFAPAGGQFERTGTYLWDEGTLRFVAPTKALLAKGPGLVNSDAEVSADGRQMAFITGERLTEAPIGGSGGALKRTMYLYDETTGRLKCLSCLPSGMPTASQAYIEPLATEMTGTGGLTNQFNPRFLSEDGRYVFFTTLDALSGQDVNNRADVYEYDVQTGALSLVTSGTGEDGSWFIGSSTNGSDVFFVSRQSYLAEDGDPLIDMYDARVNGGFPQPKPQTGGCVGEECQGLPSAAPSFNTASGFEGLGNVQHQSSAAKAKAKGKARKLTRAQKLARALKACKRKRGTAHHRCVALARKRYGPKRAKKSISHRARL